MIQFTFFKKFTVALTPKFLEYFSLSNYMKFILKKNLFFIFFSTHKDENKGMFLLL